MRLGDGLVRGRLPGLGDDLGQLVRIVVVILLVLEFERIVILAPFPGRQPRLPGFVATRQGLVRRVGARGRGERVRGSYDTSIRMKDF